MAKALPWSSQELAILDEVFPAEGIKGAADALPERSCQAINVMASKRGLRSPVVGKAPTPRLKGDELEEAIRLREEQGWSFARIGVTYGVCESSACSAVLIALCARKGFTPAQRDTNGRLTEEGKERVRLALRKGLKGVDIQLRLGVSASCVAEQRRRYQRDLKARGKATLPPPGGGKAYSGVKVPKSKKAEIEALYLTGLGAARIAQRTGASKTTCLRVRRRLIKRLARQGKTLPGCDITGRRTAQVGSARHITAAQIDALRNLLLDRMPVQAAAATVAIGSCSAYRIRDQLAREFEAAGQQLPKPIRSGRHRAGEAPTAYWPPQGPSEIFRFRKLLGALGLLEAVRTGRVGLMPAFARAHLQARLPTEERPPR